jgi:hypothetical protein
MKHPITIENFIPRDRYRWMITYCDRVLANPDLSPSVRKEYLERKAYFEELLRSYSIVGKRNRLSSHAVEQECP